MKIFTNQGSLFLKTFSWIAYVALIAGCASHDLIHSTGGSYRNYTEIKGTIKDGRYFSPDRNFSCAVPPLAKPGAVIRDSSNKTADGYVGTVKFEDDHGKLFRVDWAEVPPDIGQQLGKPLYDQVMLKAWLTFHMQNFHQVYPQATVEAEEYTSDKTNLILFADVRIPKGATLTDNGQHLDCSRGLFIFKRNNWVYTISIQDVGVDSADIVSFNSFHPSNPTVEERKADLKPRLGKFLEGFEFK